MRRLVALSLLLLVGSRAASAVELDDPTLDNFHWGVEYDMMPGGPLGGSMMASVALLNKNWNFTAGAGYDYARDKKNGNQSLVQFEFKAARRNEIADYTYFDYGWDYPPV